MKTLTIAVLGFVLLPVSVSAQFPQTDIQQQYRATTKPMIACPTLERYDVQRNIASSGNAESWVAFLEKAECRRVKALTDVVVKEIIRRDDVVCVKSMNPPQEEGWHGCLYASISEVRRLDRDEQVDQ